MNFSSTEKYQTCFMIVYIVVLYIVRTCVHCKTRLCMLSIYFLSSTSMQQYRLSSGNDVMKHFAQKLSPKFGRMNQLFPLHYYYYPLAPSSIALIFFALKFHQFPHIRCCCCRAHHNTRGSAIFQVVSIEEQYTVGNSLKVGRV